MTSTISKVTPRAIFMLILATSFYCFEFFLQVAPAAMTHELMHAFHSTGTQLGILASAFYYAYTFFQIPAGLILDKLGCRIILASAAIICALGLLYFGLAHSLYQAVFARFIIGTGSTVAFICTLYIILRWFPARTFAMLAGVAQFMSGLGAIGGEAPLALLTNAVGWRSTSLLLALIGSIISIIIFIFLRNQPNENNNLIRTTPKIPIFAGLQYIVRQRQMWWVAVYAFACWVPATAFAALWGVPFLKTALHLSTVQAAGAVSWIWVGVAVGSPLIGWLSDHWNNRCWFLASSPLIGAAALVMIIYLTPQNILLLWLLLFIVGVGGAGQTLIFAFVKDINLLKYTSVANGFTNMAVVSSGAILQPVIGLLLDGHWTGMTTSNGVPLYSIGDYQWALCIIPGFCLLAGVIARVFLKETHCRQTAFHD
jgi:MFS family permease